MDEVRILETSWRRCPLYKGTQTLPQVILQVRELIHVTKGSATLPPLLLPLFGHLWASEHLWPVPRDNPVAGMHLQSHPHDNPVAGMHLRPHSL